MMRRTDLTEQTGDCVSFDYVMFQLTLSKPKSSSVLCIVYFEFKSPLLSLVPNRRTLFRHSSILSHSVGSGASAFSHKKTRIVSDSEDQRQCTSHFIEPVQWMEPALLGVMDGQLLCPKCSSKLGSFNWYGEQCSCGRWVTPAFQMHKNRVDEIKHISISALK
ncbi:hypothetical protein cypCar_00012659 [Cyprinus carpio]|nr:hypothetical protein cypCar_00012659 [Cyprinus carpio]